MLNRMKKTIAVLTAMISAFSAAAVLPEQQDHTVEAASGILAFPGAVGGGKYATGGRGGEVYHVTNLNDSGAGSLRDAVSKSNRIVVFDVSGTIELQSNIVCQSNITIAGQTAPGGSGITLKNYKLGLGGTNCIVRYLSSRPGPYKATSSGNDALGGAGGSNSILDHCSIGWASDEQWGLYSKNDNYTLQYSIIGPANSWGGHAKGVHGFGIMFGRANFSFDHNLIIHCVSRNFRGKVTDQNAADFTNNIIYDWGYQTTYGTVGHINYVNNTLKAGNSTTGAYYYAQVSDNANFAFYLNGNRILNKDNTVRNAPDANWSAMKYNDSKSEATTRVDTHFPIMVNGEDVSTVLTAESAEDSYEHVISFAGNGISPTTRTAIDQQCAADTKNGTGSCSGTAAYDSSVTDLDKYKIECGVTYTYPSAVLEKTITDTDNDGMPDEWEEARGLNPNDASDTNGDYCGQGYTNIEYYINDLTIDSFPVGVVTPSPETANLVTISAFDRIEAESYSSQSGILTEDLAEGGQNIGFVENGDYLLFRRVDFGDGAKQFNARVSGNAAQVELYLDNLTNPVAAYAFDGSGNFTNWTDIAFNTGTITGVHNLYIKFTGGEGYLMNMDYFTFQKDAIPMNGTLFTNVIVNDSSTMDSWKIAYNAQFGSLLFGDRDVTFATLPDALVGAEILQTACDGKTFAGDQATFTAGADMDVYVLLDNRVTEPGAWLSGWELTSMTAANNNDVTFNIYKKSCKAGDNVTLGTNNQSAYCVNYTVLALEAPAQETTEPSTEATEPTTEATVPTTEETEPTTVPFDPTELPGDANCDNTVDILDVIALNKALLIGEDISEAGRLNADVDGDGQPTSADSLTILKYTIGLVEKLPL